MGWLLRWKFLVLLTAMVMLLVVYPVLRDFLDGRLLFHALLTAVFLAAFLVVFREGSLRVLGLLLGIPTVVGAWTGYVLPGLPRPPLLAGFHLVAATFLALTAATILRNIHRDKSVSADSIYGAFCGYLLIGVVFGHLYCLLSAMAPSSFQGIQELTDQLHDEVGSHFLLTYFSLVTLTTVGYGDITPASDAARGLAVVEAVVGQFYIAVLIAELIGKRVSQPPPGG